MEEENISQNVSTNYVEPPAITIATTTAIADAEPTDNTEVKGKSKKSQFGILKLAVGRFQPRPKTDQKKKKEKTKPAKSKKNVGSMRPSHLEEDIQSSTASVSVVSPHASPRKEDGNLSDENFICISDASSPTTSLSSKRSGIGTITPHASAVNLQELDNPMSQYSSAVNLQELDTTQSRYASAVNLQDLDAPMSQYGSTNNLQDLKEDEEMFKDPDEVHGRISGDAMIDTKAEEFIAQFHKVLRHEQMNRRHSPQIRMG
ncbi:hypothetical protein LIER_42976 [Lithospermum erythrorhizon]|uniref:Uncharacterized protein n=1 Tax=Lithospermum erythrorhizon TaxID=34254 RepID=A0AAV3P9V8_LITER